MSVATDFSELRIDPEAAAQAAQLRYVSDEQPGYTRQRRGRGFAYYDNEGELVTSERLKARFKELVIPPAWQDVWICRSPSGHVQATGFDEKGRKQYLYHERWREVRDRAKFEALITFGQMLPELRKRVESDLQTSGLSKTRLLAAAVTLLERTLIRVGNPEYARENKHYGLTTLRKKHLTLTGSTIAFDFVGKSGVERHIKVKDRKLAGIIRACSELPGYEILKYQDDDGQVQVLESDDINSYLKDITGEGFTAKDFRTWAACYHVSEELCTLPCSEIEKERNQAVTQAIKQVAQKLGHTPVVCRASYVYPRILSDYQTRYLLERFTEARARCKVTHYRSEHEAALAVYLTLD
jgi:DNA topoisomerase-1